MIGIGPYSIFQVLFTRMLIREWMHAPSSDESASIIIMTIGKKLRKSVNTCVGEVLRDLFHISVESLACQDNNAGSLLFIWLKSQNQ